MSPSTGKIKNKCKLYSPNSKFSYSANFKFEFSCNMCNRQYTQSSHLSHEKSEHEDELFSILLAKYNVAQRLEI